MGCSNWHCTSIIPGIHGSTINKKVNKRNSHRSKHFELLRASFRCSSKWFWQLVDLSTEGKVCRESLRRKSCYTFTWPDSSLLCPNYPYSIKFAALQRYNENGITLIHINRNCLSRSWEVFVEIKCSQRVKWQIKLKLLLKLTSFHFMYRSEG